MWFLMVFRWTNPPWSKPVQSLRATKTALGWEKPKKLNPSSMRWNFPGTLKEDVLKKSLQAITVILPNSCQFSKGNYLVFVSRLFLCLLIQVLVPFSQLANICVFPVNRRVRLRPCQLMVLFLNFSLKATVTWQAKTPNKTPTAIWPTSWAAWMGLPK